MANLFPPTLILIQSHYTKENANKTFKKTQLFGRLILNQTLYTKQNANFLQTEFGEMSRKRIGIFCSQEATATKLAPKRGPADSEM